MLTELASRMESGEPLWAALPHSFFSVGIDPHEAIGRLESRDWRVSTLLEDLLPDDALARIKAGEENAELVGSLRWARRDLPLTMCRT